PRVLILGGTGMLGHKLWQVCRARYDTFVTVRTDDVTRLPRAIFDPDRAIPGVAATDFDSVARAFAAARPAVVVNCIGLVKQRPAAQDALASIAVNALFPHRLALLCRATGTRLIHVSTDCVFSGRRGGYTEDDLPDPVDLYGRTKLLGEVADGALTIRTSMVGRELAASQGLVEWFLGRRGGTAAGFRRAIFSGLTTGALAETIATIVREAPALTGVWHVAAAPIAKYELLALVRDAMRLDIALAPDDRVVIDRSLDGSRFSAATGWRAPAWPEMVAALAGDPTPYADLRGGHAGG
ncbi:MAG TPA: SDR family oxidoreductase, partial [Thermomicrobiales bacterium]|nr:SDR family oxidoreductase [Thermomicrobiales bacterium]